MRFIRHITLNTGHARDSYASEVSPEAVAVCAELIERMAAGEQPAIPGFDSFGISGVAYGKCLVATVWSGREPIVTIGIATHSRCGSETWRALHASANLPVLTDSEHCPPEPWCAARLEPASEWYPDVMDWAGDFERCLAWAFYRRRHDDP